MATTSTEIIHNYTKATPSPSVPRIPVVPKDKGSEDEPGNEVDAAKGSHIPTWLYGVVSVCSVCAVTSVIFSAVLLFRARRRSQRLNRGEVGRDDGEENFSLHEIPPENGEEGQGLQQNYEEEPRLPVNADEEERLLQPDEGGNQNQRRQNHEKMNLQPAETYLHWRNADVEEHVARQETQPPDERTTSSTSTIVR